jgi:formylglycine-generating enzyme required for sulfatase activity
VQETLDILLIKCAERDCEVIYHAQELLEKIGLQPLQPGGIIHELFDLAHAAERQQKLLADPANHFEWIEVKGGKFWMGDDEHGGDEKPAHRVKVDGFRMTKHPVTNRMLAEFPFGSQYSGYGGESHPAIGNNWFQAYYFALWIGARLPTEAEWEYAARGGKQAKRTQYYFGDAVEELPNHAWFGESGREHAHAVDEINPRTGKENLNPLGLANMLGNVWDWCADRYDSNYYANSPESNPKGPAQGTQRVLRGGAWHDDAVDLRCAYRNGGYPAGRGTGFGFRCAQDVR